MAIENRYNMQIEYIDLDDKVIKIRILDDKQQIVRSEFFVYNELTFTMEKIKEDLLGFIEENHLVLNSKLDVILASRDTYCTTIILPKSNKTKLFIENEIADKFGINYKEKFAVYQKTSKYNKDGTITFVSLITVEQYKFFQELAIELKLKLGNITSISLYLYELEHKGDRDEITSDNHISLYIREYYSVFNVVSKGEIVSTLIHDYGHSELLKLNIVRRFNKIQQINSNVLSLAGHNELSLKNGEIDSFYLYVQDEGLKSQFASKKFNIPYIALEDNEEKFISFTNVYTYKKQSKSVFAKRGFTLVETVTSLAVFMILAVTMVTLLLQCMKTSRDDEYSIIKTSFLMDMYERFKVMPENNAYIADFYKEYDAESSFTATPDGKGDAIFYLDTNFKPVDQEEKCVYKAYLLDYSKAGHNLYSETFELVNNLNNQIEIQPTEFVTTLK